MELDVLKSKILKLESALNKSEKKEELPVKMKPMDPKVNSVSIQTVENIPIAATPTLSQLAQAQFSFGQLYSPLPLTSPYPSNIIGTNSYQVPGASSMYDQSQRQFQFSDSSPLLIGESPGFINGSSYKQEQSNSNGLDSTSSGSINGVNTYSDNSTISDPTSVESYALEMREYEKELSIFSNRLSVILSNVQIDPKLVELLGGRQFKFNVHELFPEDGFSTPCDNNLYFGIFSFRAYGRVDSALFYLWNYLDNIFYSSGIDQIFTPDSTNDIKMELKKTQVEKSQLNMGEVVKDTGKTLGLNVESNYSDDLSLIAKIEMSLPNRKVIWKLVDIFFVAVYPRVPFVDELDFRKTVARLIGPDVNTTSPLIKISKDIDFADLGILLIILRLSYLSLFSTDNKENEIAFNSNDPDPIVQEKKYLLNNPINVESFYFSQQCLNKFNLFNVSDLKVLLLLLYTQAYRSIGPEFGMEPESNSNYTLLGLLFQMAVSLGLHRDPEKYKKTLPLNIMNLRRKIWFQINMEDILSGYVIGLPMRGHAISSDCKPPGYSAEESNLMDLGAEMINQKACRLFDKRVLVALLNFLVNFLDTNKSHNFEDLILQSTTLEKAFKFYHDNLELELFQSKEMEYFDMVKYKVHLCTHGSHISIIFHFFNYFDKLNETELSFYFLNKIFTEYLPLITELNHIMSKPNKLIGLVIAIALTVIHKIIFVVLAVHIRVKIFIATRKINSDKEHLYNSFHETLCNHVDYLLKFVNKFSDKYYYSWFIIKSTKFVMKSMDAIANTQDERFIKYKSKINLSILEDTNKVSALNCTMTGINEELKNFENRSTLPFLNDNIDNLWLYLSSMNESSANVGILDTILKDLENTS